MIQYLLVVILVVVTLSSCSTSTMEIVSKLESTPQVSKSVAQAQEKGLKRKVAIARFSNETKHGNSFLLDEKQDRIGKQASDILSARLTDTGKFLMLERQDLFAVKAEQNNVRIDAADVGADFLIVGSVSEFGRSTISEVGIFSRNMKQHAKATVNVRLVEVKTGQIVFSQEGSGEAFSEANKVFGVGETSGYDSQLDDEALSAAISKLVSNLIENLLDNPWAAYVLDQQQGQVIISGGKSQGIKAGDNLKVIKRGRSVKNPQTGFMIEMPGEEIAQLKVVSFAGEGNNEVSICTVSSGSIAGISADQLIVREM